MNNTELIARLREGQTYDFNTGLPDDMSCPMGNAADAIEELEAEVERLTTLAHGQHIELYNARLKLAAAQGLAAAWKITHDAVLNGAAPIPQQPAQPLTDKQIEHGWKQTFSTENPFCPCNLKSFTKAVRWALAAAPQPKEKQ